MELREQHCIPVVRGSLPLETATCQQHLSQLDGAWSLSADGLAISREFRFPDFYQAMAFVNAVAWIAQREDHHPELQVGYKHVAVEYTTHAAAGLTLNDFICAAQIDHLLKAA